MKGIYHKFTPRYSSEYNKVAERIEKKELKKMMNALLVNSNSP